jgi:hypothetical protein
MLWSVGYGTDRGRRKFFKAALPVMTVGGFFVFARGIVKSGKVNRCRNQKDRQKTGKFIILGTFQAYKYINPVLTGD